jgi:hypothetical protein
MDDKKHYQEYHSFDLMYIFMEGVEDWTSRPFTRLFFIPVKKREKIGIFERETCHFPQKNDFF